MHQRSAEKSRKDPGAVKLPPLAYGAEGGGGGADGGGDGKRSVVVAAAVVVAGDRAGGRTRHGRRGRAPRAAVYGGGTEAARLSRPLEEGGGPVPKGGRSEREADIERSRSEDVVSVGRPVVGI